MVLNGGNKLKQYLESKKGMFISLLKGVLIAAVIAIILYSFIGIKVTSV